MKKSIFKRLFIMMVGNILVFTILIYGSNLFFAKNYYVNNKKELLLAASQKISNVLDEATIPLAPKDIISINAVAKSIGGSVIIGDTKRNIYLSDRIQQAGRPNKEVRNSFYEIELDNETPRLVLPNTADAQNVIVNDFEQYDDHSIFFNALDPELQIDTLRYQSSLANDFTILIWVPLSEINESISLSNSFTLIVALLTLCITVVISYFASMKFTKPITEMNTQAKSMVDLDFSQQLTVMSNDEIGQLSLTINQLSSKLNDTIEELNIKNQELTKDINKKEELEQMRKEFISNVSHELKTPIFLIQGYAEGLHSNVVGDEAKRAFYSKVIMEEADKMDLMVKDLLDISQLESGSYSINLCTFNIDELAYDVVKKLTPTFEDQGIKFTLNSDTKVAIIADPIRIEQVLMNLLTNGVNHCNNQKMMTFKLIKTTNNTVKISIFNTGSQIPEEALDKIWSSFFKVDEARTRDYNGSGLGLSIVKNILQLHHGKYGVSNKENGVEFWFELDLIH